MISESLIFVLIQENSNVMSAAAKVLAEILSIYTRILLMRFSTP